MIRGSFLGFTTAQRALNANQKALDVTGQNIANFNTVGYTRQRLDLYSVASGGIGDRYSGNGASAVGRGVEIARVAQVRDPFLDVRFRREAPKVGELDARLEILNDLESVFDETMMDGVGAQISDLVKQLQALSTKTGNADFDGIVKASAQVLTNMLNSYSNQLSTLRDVQTGNLENITVPKVNDLMKNIAELNKTIKQNQIHGNPSLELMDRRNEMLDELSAYVKIDISIKPVEISPGVIVEDMTVNMLTGGTPSSIPIIANEKFASLDVGTGANGDKTITVKQLDGVTNTDVTKDLTTGALKGYLDMLNGKGEFAGAGENSTKGIGYYEGMLNTLAQTFADSMNALNGGAVTNTGYDPTITDPKDPNFQQYTSGILNPNYDPTITNSANPNSQKYLNEARPLFEAKGGGTITANNITIAQGWKDNTYGVTNTKVYAEGNTDGANENIAKMIAFFSEKVQFSAPNTTPLFKGTLQEFLTQTGNVLALDAGSTEKLLKNSVSVLDGISDLRDGISAVSLDEEGVSLLRFQKSYNAAARLMTTLDEAIDLIINRMGVVGR